MLRLGAVGTFGLWIREDIKTTGVDNMKKVIALSLLAITTGAFAQGAGFYMGVGAGESNTKFNNEDFPKDASVLESKDHDKAWKLFVGYNANQYFGMEAGYADLGIARYVFNDSTRYKVGSLLGLPLPKVACRSMKNSMSSASLVLLATTM